MKINKPEQNTYRGRFAPSPSGELHFGSLLAAMASYADARNHDGCWLLRIDDIDQARVIKNSDQHILNSLEQCGFNWDEQVSYQSHNIRQYQHALQQLNNAGLCYPCSCSRKQLKEISTSSIYPGLCRNKSPQSIDSLISAIRITVPAATISFRDQIQNDYSQKLNEDVGDFIIYRRDKVFSYQLSVVVDDFHSNITHIVRGFDLLDSTPKQIYLQQMLGYAQPYYAHIPLAVTEENVKLSKLSHAKKVNCELKTLALAARFLGQDFAQITPNDKDFDNKHDFWQALITHWDINKVPRMEKQVIMY